MSVCHCGVEHYQGEDDVLGGADSPKLEPVSTERNGSGPVAALKIGIDVGHGTSLPIEDSGTVTIVLLVDRAFRSEKTLLKAKTGEISC